MYCGFRSFSAPKTCISTNSTFCKRSNRQDQGPAFDYYLDARLGKSWQVATCHEQIAKCNLSRKSRNHSRERGTSEMNFKKEFHLTATHCNTLQHTATHCNTLQYTATWKRNEWDEINTTQPLSSWLKSSLRIRLHIELPAKLLDYFLRSNKSKINQKGFERIDPPSHQGTILLFQVIKAIIIITHKMQLF